MLGKTQRIRILALLLGMVFLGAQFHFCADLTATPSASHIIAVVPFVNRLELPPLLVSPGSAVPRATSPRAPPAL
jgi:hypothetical protein